MKKLYFLLASTFMFGLLAGCQSSDTPAGNGDSTTTTEKPADPAADNGGGGGGHVGTWTLIISEDMKAQFEEAKKAGGVPEDAKLPQMSFTLKEDGTCSMAGDFDGARYEAKGTYKVEGGNIVITPTESFVNGEPDPNASNEPVTLTWSADKTMLESTDPGEKMQFKKG
jgi:hypothetical protein